MMEDFDSLSLHKGLFLIASPDMDHPFYKRSVVLLCDHTPAGSFGLAINKDLDHQIAESLTKDADLSILSKVTARTGGIMQPTQMMLLHQSEGIPEQTLKIHDDLFLGGDVEFLEKAVEDSSSNILLCFGYSGWNPGQLEKEYVEGKWFTFPAISEYIFNLPPEKLWQTILQDMGGKYRSLSLIPEKPELN